MTAGEKGPKHPILSPKNLLETRDKRRAAAEGARPRPLSFHACFAWEPTHTPGFLPAAGHGWGGGRGCPSAAAQSSEGHPAEAGGHPGGYIWKRIWKPFQQIYAKGTGPMGEVAPGAAPSPERVPPPPAPRATPVAASRSPPACFFLERETTQEKLRCKPLPAQARKKSLHPRLPPPTIAKIYHPPRPVD